jgi:hypothetical protein
MKKSFSILLGVLMVLGLVSFGLSQAAQAPAPKSARAEFSGTINGVTRADPSTGTKTSIVVINDASNKMSFQIIETTTLSNAKGETIGLNEIVKGQEVSVEYETVSEGVYVAVSVKLIK